MTADLPPLVLPSRDDPVVAAASTSIGGPVGRYARIGASWWSPIRVMLLLVILASALGVGLDQPCRGEAWSDGTTQFSRACYSDIVHLYWGRGIGDGVVPYVGDPSATGDEQVEYPVLTGATMWVLSFPVPDDWQYADRGRLYFDINAIAIALLAAVTVWATAKTSGPRRWDAAMVAVAPGLILTSTINWDMWAVALLSLGLLAWARRYPLLAGILIGLATAYKFYPLLVLGPLLVLCFRAGRMRAFGLTILATAVTWLSVNVPIMLVNYDGWARFYQLSRERGADFGSIWLVFQGWGLDLPVSRLNLWGSVLFAALCIGIGLLGLLAPRRPRLAQLVFLTVAAFLLTNKVYSPQYVLWLIPLAVLARPRWRDFIWWQAAEVIYFFAVWWYILDGANPDRGLPERGYWLAIGVHVIATAVYCGFVVRDALLPEYDPVRSSTGMDDPGGGVLADAPDRFGGRNRTAQDEEPAVAVSSVMASGIDDVR
ncbi:MAG TPA: glycosyltransferase 87 family protein [Actinomycetes bacterium]|nr:glycosyltransferase 87 family protein [Actinomycetes bacterium]